MTRKAPENELVLLQKEVREKVLCNQNLSVDNTDDYEKIVDYYKKQNQSLISEVIQ